MDIHYFQRYHQKENVATSNTMLLLSRLYGYSPDLFFRCIRSILRDKMGSDFNPELIFKLQTKTAKSVLDASIGQKGFKIGIETKLSDWFYKSQLENHISYFETKDEDNILITLSKGALNVELKDAFEKSLKEYNSKSSLHIVHAHLTFESLYEAISAELDERDYEFRDILEDYYQYLCDDELIESSEDWKYLRVQLAGATIDYNIENSIYFDKDYRKFRPHKYLGLYDQKTVKAIGEVKAIIVWDADKGDFVDEKNNNMPASDLDKKKVMNTITEAENKFGFNLHKGHRFFIVDQFYRTDFKKTSPRAPMGSRIFNLKEVLDDCNYNEKTTCKDVAEYLTKKTWG